MIKQYLIPAFLTFSFLVSACDVLKAESLEEKYFETRNEFIDKIEDTTDRTGDNSDIEELDKNALKALEIQLQAIIGNVNVEGFPKQGEINLATLQKQYPVMFGLVDGLRFEAAQAILFVTTDGLLKTYLTEWPDLPQEFSKLSKHEAFYSHVFALDSATLYYAEIPVENAKEQAYVHAFLGMTAQDIGPFIPNTLYAFVSTGNQIRVIKEFLKEELTDIQKCRAEWDKFEQKMLDPDIEDAFQYREQGFEAYRTCFEEELSNHPRFKALQEQAQSIVDRLQKN